MADETVTDTKEKVQKKKKTSTTTGKKGDAAKTSSRKSSSAASGADSTAAAPAPEAAVPEPAPVGETESGDNQQVETKVENTEIPQVQAEGEQAVPTEGQEQPSEHDGQIPYHDPMEPYQAPPQATKKDIQLLQDIDDRKLLELQEAFYLFDLNQDGIIDKDDLYNTFQSLGQPNMPEEEILQMLKEAPNPLDFDAFVVLLGYKTIELDPEETLLEALSQWDYDSSGLISEERIRHDLMTWGDKFTEHDVDVALEEAPVYLSKKGQPMIDYVKFCSSLAGLRKKPKMKPPTLDELEAMANEA